MEIVDNFVNQRRANALLYSYPTLTTMNARAKKKITVVFRGTVPSFFDRDVATDLDVRKTPVEIPEDLLQEGDEKEMFIHNGFLGKLTLCEMLSL